MYVVISHLLALVVMSLVLSTPAHAQSFSTSSYAQILTSTTDCPASVTTASQGQECMNTTTGQRWYCKSPAAGGSSTTLCDAVPDWLVETATATLSGTPTLCSVGNAPLGILANGNSTGCFDVATQAELDTAIATRQPLATTLTTLAGKEVQGSGSDVRMSTGTFATNDYVKIDGGGNFVSGGAVSSGGLTDPGGPGLVKRTTLNTTVAATAGTDYVVPSGSITGNAATATLFDHIPTPCSSGQAPLGIMSGGGAFGCFDVATQVELDASAATKQPLAATLTTLTAKAVQGNGTDIRLSTGPFAPGDFITIDNGGNFVSAGADCSGCGGGTGGGLADPGANGLVKRTALNTTVAATPGTDYVIPSGNITGNAGTATSFDHSPTLCSAGNAPVGITSNGAAQNCFDVATQPELNTAVAGLQPLDPDLTTLAGKNIVGTGPDVRLSTGSFATNDYVKIDASGNFVSGGAGPGGGSGTLQQACTNGCGITSAISAGTAMTVGGPAGGWQLYYNASEGSVLKAYPDQNGVFGIASGKEIQFKTSGGAIPLKIDDAGVVTGNINGTANNITGSLALAQLSTVGATVGYIPMYNGSSVVWTVPPGGLSRATTDAIDLASAVKIGGPAYYTSFYGNATEGVVWKINPAQVLNFDAAATYSIGFRNGTGVDMLRLDEPTKNATFGGAITANNQGVIFANANTKTTCTSGMYAFYPDRPNTKIRQCVNGVEGDVGVPSDAILPVVQSCVFSNVAATSFTLTCVATDNLSPTLSTLVKYCSTGAGCTSGGGATSTTAQNCTSGANCVFNITGLTAGVPYHLTMQATDQASNTGFSSELSQTTSSDYYVNATGGNNSNTCAQAQLVGSPKATITGVNGGLSCLSAGGTVVVKAGTYAETIAAGAIPNGTATAQTTVKAAPGETVTIQPASGTNVITFTGQSYITLDGFIVHGSGVSAQALQINDNAGTGSQYLTFQNMEIRNSPGLCVFVSSTPNHHLSFLNTKIHHCGTTANHHGLYLKGSNHTINRSQFYNNGENGLMIYDGTTTTNSNNIITNSLFHHNLGNGLQMGAGANNLAYNNLIYNNTGYGIYINWTSATNTQAFNNTIYTNSSCIVIGGSSSGAKVRNNICFGNTTNAPSDSGSSTLSNNHTADPLFIDATNGNFHVGTTSPVLDFGTSTDVTGVVNVDYDNVGRPQGAAYSAGAFETGTVAPDTTPPSVTGCSSLYINATSFRITCTSITDAVSSSFNARVRYCTSGAACTAAAGGTGTTLTSPPVVCGTTNCSVDVTGLTAGTQYYARLEATDQAGNIGPGAEQVPTISVTYYVSPTGSDANSCTAAKTISTPKKTLTGNPPGPGNGGAIECLSAGQTLLVRAGTYAESIYCPGSGSGAPYICIPSGSSWSAPVTVAAYPNESVTIKPNAGPLRVINFAQTQQYIIFKNFIIDGTNLGYDGIQIEGTANHIRIEGNEVRNNSGNGINVGWDTGFTEIVNNWSHHNGTDQFEHGIYISSSNNLIQGNTTNNNAAYGIHVYNSQSAGHNLLTSNNTVVKNRSYSNGQFLPSNSAGILIGSGSNNIAYNNIVYDNPIGIRVGYNACNANKVYNNTIYHNVYSSGNIGLFVMNSCTNATLTNNIVYGQPPNDILDQGSGTTQTAGTNLTANPIFTNPGAGDFTLQSTSPAINNGATVSAVPDDFAGVARPIGSKYDIGAYESSFGVGSLAVQGEVEFRFPDPDAVTVLKHDSTNVDVVNTTDTTPLFHSLIPPYLLAEQRCLTFDFGGAFTQTDASTLTVNVEYPEGTPVAACTLTGAQPLGGLVGQLRMCAHGSPTTQDLLMRMTGGEGRCTAFAQTHLDTTAKSTVALTGAFSVADPDNALLWRHVTTKLEGRSHQE